MAKLAADPEPELTHVEPEEDIKMTIWEHLGELRKRVVRAGVTLIAGAVLCWSFKEKLLYWVARPYETAWKLRYPTVPVELMTTAPIDAFVGYMQLALTGGVVLAAPVIFYQLWAFISPGLYSKEKRYIIPFVLFSTMLFVAGIAFCYYAFFPSFWDVQLSLHGQVGDPGGLVLMSRNTLEGYLDFATRMLLAFGFIFELPLFISFLALAGIVTPMQLVRFSRYAVIAAFVVGAFITPGPEMSSQFIVAAALVGLYFLSVGLSFLVAKKREPDPT